MILVALAGLAALTVPLRGRSLGRLAELRIHCLWVPIAAVTLQVVITVVAPGGDAGLHRGLQLASYAMVAVFLVANRRLPGLWVIALGAALNAVAITANGGVMPASAVAERIAGLHPRAGFDNSAVVAHPRLAALGDVLPWPGPLHNVLSVGDLLIVAGLVVLLHRACRRPRLGAAAPPAGSALELEADAHLDLEVGDIAILDVAADRADLDPVEVAQRR